MIETTGYTGNCCDGSGKKDRPVISADQIGTLVQLAGMENVFEHEPMSEHTTFRIGGPADVLVSPVTMEALTGVIRYLDAEQIPYYVIGNGSNLLVGDKGYRGVIVQVYKNLSAITVEGSTIKAEAGAMISAVSRTAMTHGLTGLEFASGIPGTTGGAVVMNAGAYGGEMKDVIVSVTVLTPEGNIREIPASDMAFGYRTSCVMKNHYIVLGAVFRLREGKKDDILARMQELKEKRVSKQPLDKPSAGSTFKRPEGYFAGKLIMDAGLKGFTVGGACVSEKHAGFVINNGGATAQDVRQLISHVQNEVKKRFGVSLECEIRMIGE